MKLKIRRELVWGNSRQIKQINLNAVEQNASRQNIIIIIIIIVL